MAQLQAQPGTIQPLVFSSDDATKLNIVSTSFGLPVTGTVTVTPSGTQDENIKQVNGATVNVGPGASGTGTIRVTTSTDSTIGTVASSTPVKSTTATTSQVTVPATTNGISILAANANRLGAVVTNLGTVPIYWSGAATGLTVSNGAVIPANSSLIIDGPLYTGLIQGIISTSTQVVDVVEFT